MFTRSSDVNKYFPSGRVWQKLVSIRQENVNALKELNKQVFCGKNLVPFRQTNVYTIKTNEENFNYTVDLISCIYRVVIKEKFNCKSINKICDLMKALELDEHYHLEFKQFQDSLTNY